MSFGISISDFITVAKIIADIAGSLKDAKSEYQELLRELESLDRALKTLDKLHPDSDGGSDSHRASAATLDGIKCAALTCRYPLEEFLRKIKKYEGNLGIVASSSASKTKGVLRRVEWVWSKKDETKKLQSYLSIHVGTINMLLVEHGLEKLDFVSKQSMENQRDIQRSFENANAMMVHIESHTTSQALVVEDNNKMLKNLLSIVRRDIVIPLKAFTSMVARVW
jgi:hypothetical protein